MATTLKYIYNPAYFEKLCPVLEEALPGFDRKQFIFRIFNNDWPDKELKERVRHITQALHVFMPKEFAMAAQKLALISKLLRSHFGPQSIENAFLADYAEVYGIHLPEESLKALRESKKPVSAESFHYAI
jgi:hypothetical protein